MVTGTEEKHISSFSQQLLSLYQILQLLSLYQILQSAHFNVYCPQLLESANHVSGTTMENLSEQGTNCHRLIQQTQPQTFNNLDGQ